MRSIHEIHNYDANIRKEIVDLFESRRKILTMSTYITLGLICLTIGITTKFDPEQTIIIKVFFLLGKFLSSITVSCVFLLLAESFPAECRLLGEFKSRYSYTVV